MLIIPFFTDSCFSQDIVLDAVPYHLRIYWNSRGAFWAIDVYDRDLNPLVMGIKIVNDYELFTNHPDRDLPPGLLLVVDYRGTDFDIAFDDFTNGNCDLVYIAEAELIA